jgi:hypothetical protein
MFICLAGNLSAQQPAVRDYLPNTADEDWSFFSERCQRNDFWAPLKYIPLGRKGHYLTVSSEIRYRAEGFHLPSDGRAPSTTDTCLLQRDLVGADLHLGPRFRLYTEFQSDIINGQLRSPRPIWILLSNFALSLLSEDLKCPPPWSPSSRV